MIATAIDTRFEVVIRNEADGTFSPLESYLPRDRAERIAGLFNDCTSKRFVAVVREMVLWRLNAPDE